jgi:hypothetical protein
MLSAGWAPGRLTRFVSRFPKESDNGGDHRYHPQRQAGDFAKILPVPEYGLKKEF